MTSREKIEKIFNRNSTGKTGFWVGNPDGRTSEIYLKQLGLKSNEEFYRYVNDDCRWCDVSWSYRAPDGSDAINPYLGKEHHSLSAPGYFADCEDATEVEKYPWPNPDYLNFDHALEYLSQYQEEAVFTGFWSPFFHQLCDFFGMENYFCKMYTDPEVVKAVTERVVDYYVEANDRFFTALGDKQGIFFFGNDFGTQKDCLISPEAFDEFVLPGFKRLINVAKKHNRKVLLHSCGSIYRVIPKLIDAGIDGLHPLQAKAVNMDAQTLAREFKNDLTFVGGVDTQDLLVTATPQQVRDEVYRLRELFGDRFIVSPSHECILPNVPLENVLAMAETAKE